MQLRRCPCGVEHHDDARSVGDASERVSLVLHQPADLRGNFRPTLPGAADDRLHLVKVASAQDSVEGKNVPVLAGRGKF